MPSSSGVPDLKAALIVLRQTLQSALGADATTAAKTAPTLSTSPTPVQVQVQAPAGLPNAAPSLVPSAAPEIDMPEIVLPQARLLFTEEPTQAVGFARTALSAALDHGPSAGATLNLLQEALQELGNPVRVNAAMPKAARGDDVIVHTNTPPPPFRGAQPTPQPVALPSIAPDAPLATTAHHLLEHTDAAIARQTLMQVASLPDRIDGSGPRIDVTAPRWNFEIPFVTPLGTAMAQFEISGDGGGSEVEAARRVWRARFTIDVEPTGPIHALVSLAGEKTSVRMWAERPSTAAQLRASTAELSQALAKAELQPGEIVIRDGAPPQPAPAKAGHFLDRAL
jgi:hypothetical protein